MPPLDILYIGTLPPHPGGSAISGSQLLVQFASLGHRIRAVSPITSTFAGGVDEFAARHPRIDVIRYPVPDFSSCPTHCASTVWQR